MPGWTVKMKYEEQLKSLAPLTFKALQGLPLTNTQRQVLYEVIVRDFNTYLDEDITGRNCPIKGTD